MVEELPEILQTAAMKNIYKMMGRSTMKKIMYKCRKKLMMRLKKVHFRGTKIHLKKKVALALSTTNQTI